MCCFSRPVDHVSQTQIFARPLPDGLQYLVYRMSFAAAEDLAMILPLPVPPRPPEDAVRFIDLEGYDDFFVDVGKAFPRIMLVPKSRGLFSRGAQAAEPRLKVHDVGVFEASFVPAVDDFDRLDERFRLSPEVWAKLPRYRDWGFAVFKLKQRPVGFFGRLLKRDGRPRTVHPMALCFPRRDVRSAFFPTVHVHDGEVHDRAVFDHTLYYQRDERTPPARDWEMGQPLGRHVDIERAHGIVNGELPCDRLVLLGPRENADVTVPAGV